MFVDVLKIKNLNERDKSELKALYPHTGKRFLWFLSHTSVDVVLVIVLLTGSKFQCHIRSTSSFSTSLHACFSEFRDKGMQNCTIIP